MGEHEKAPGVCGGPAECCQQGPTRCPSLSPLYRDELSIGEDITVSSMMLPHIKADL